MDILTRFALWALGYSFLWILSLGARMARLAPAETGAFLFA